MLETLNSYVPVLIRRRFAKSPEPLHAAEYESLEAGVLLADISGFTRLTEELVRGGPRGVEKVSIALNDYFGRWIDIISEYGGDVVKFAGDALLAIWPADATGGLRAATLQAAACALQAHNTLRGYQTAEGNPLVIRTGIAAGKMRAVHLGGMLKRWELLVVGKAISEVSITMQKAEPGTVVLSPTVLEHLGNDAHGRQLGDGYLTLVNLEGIARKFEPHQRLFQSPLEGSAALETYIPGAIRQRLAAGQIGWLAELRNVTVLFMNFPDLNSSTSLETAEEVMYQVQKTLYYYEGSVNDSFVDEKGATLLTAFGLPPFSHEDDALRATLTALEIQQRMQEMNLHLSVGIATGRAFCGSIGNDSRRKYTMIGDIVNLSARLAQAAGKMTQTESLVLVDEATMENTRQRVQFEALPPVQVKGRSEAVAIFKPKSEQRQASHISVEMVGRHEERAQLKKAMQELIQAGVSNEARIFLIEGEPGIGKSRLLAEALSQAQQLGLSSLSGTADAIEKSTPYYAWRNIFSHLFELDFTSPMAKRKQALASKLDDDLLERASLLNDILQVNFPATELTANLEGHVLAENTRALLTTILQRATRQAPRLIAIEDAHWLDSASWALLMDISRLAMDTFLMLIITTRPLTAPSASEAEQMMRLPRARHIKLAPLPAQETLMLVAFKLGVRELPAEVNTLILKKAEGHPFFSEELAYALRDAGILIIEDGTSLLAPGINSLESLDLPETVQGVIISRIDRLTPVQQLTLKVASVIGRVFEYTTLNAVYPIEAERALLRSSLVTLEKLDITPLETPDPELAYIFKHSITRDVAYDLMLFAQRRRLHKSTAEWYEKTHTKELEPYYGLLAHHYALAEESPKAIHYLEKAGDHALLRGAYVEAVSYFQEAVRISEQNRRDIHITPSQRARWEFQLGEAYMGLGTLNDSRKHFEYAAALLGWSSPQRKSVLLMSLLVQLGWQATRLIRGRPFRPALDPSQALEAARVHERLGELYYFAQDRLRLLNSGLHALNLSQKAPPSPELARAYALACSVAAIIRLHSLAKRYEERALQTAAQLNHLPAQARVFSRTGYYNIGTGNLKRAILLLDQAAEISERLRDYRQWGESAALRAWTAYLVGNFEDNRARYERVYLMAKQVGNIQYQNWGQWGQAHGLLRMSHLEEARRALTSVIKQIESGEYSGAQVVAYGLMSIVCMHTQDWANMLEYGKRLVRTEKRPNRISIADFEGYASVAEVFLALWQQDANTGILKQINISFEECQTAARRAIHSMERFARIYTLAKPRMHYLKGWLAWLEGKHQDAIRIWKNGLELLQTQQMPYEEARLHEILGRHLSAEDPETQSHRNRARDLFEKLNAHLDLNQE